jgi:hypothetical protein
VSDDLAAAEPTLASRLNTDVPHGARVWNYWLGG